MTDEYPRNSLGAVMPRAVQKACNGCGEVFTTGCGAKLCYRCANQQRQPTTAVDLPSLGVILSARDLKQSDVARHMGVHDSVVHRWVVGARPVPFLRLPALAEAIGIPLDELAPDMDPLLLVTSQPRPLRPVAGDRLPRGGAVRPDHTLAELVARVTAEIAAEAVPPPVHSDGVGTMQAGNYCGPHRYWGPSPVPGRRRA